MGFIINNSAQGERPVHPSTQWAKWKKEKFVYWDKAEQVEKDFEVPEEFIVVAEAWSITWWLDSRNCWVWSNEAYSFAKDPLIIRDNTGAVVLEWMWKDIKDKAKGMGMKLVKNIHFVTEKEPDVIRTICLNWAGLSDWINWFAETPFILSNNKIKYAWLKDWKKWANKYKFPHFEAWSTLTDDNKKIQIVWAQMLLDYHDATRVSPDEIEAKEAVDETDLPF